MAFPEDVLHQPADKYMPIVAPNLKINVENLLTLGKSQPAFILGTVNVQFPQRNNQMMTKNLVYLDMIWHYKVKSTKLDFFSDEERAGLTENWAFQRETYTPGDLDSRQKQMLPYTLSKTSRMIRVEEEESSPAKVWCM